MHRSRGKTTAPAAASTAAAEAALPLVCLVIAWSEAEPHRVGQLAFCPFGEWLIVGRGDDEPGTFAQFVTHRPGETPAVDPREEILAGDSISRRQLAVRSAGQHLEVRKTGKCPTYVNGVELKSEGVLRPGDTLRLKGELVLLCVLRPRVLALPEGLRELHAFGEPDADGIVGESPAAWTLRAQLAGVATKSDHVLVRGESGTGKELAAKAIHRRSARAKGPLVSDNAAAIPKELVSAELFGNLKDYPNAGMQARAGLIGAAHRGTLFLDEIGELARALQALMLRVLDAGEYRVIGEDRARRVDIRLVGATNRGDEVFREDFLARFKSRVRLPPLRERREDIPLLVRHLLRARGLSERRVSWRLVEHLLHHELRTNVRELETILAAAAGAASNGEGLNVPPPDPVRGSAASPVLPKPQVQAPADLRSGAPPKEVLEAYMRQYAGNKARVARKLRMSRGALYRLLESYGIEGDEGDESDEPK